MRSVNFQLLLPKRVEKGLPLTLYLHGNRGSSHPGVSLDIVRMEDFAALLSAGHIVVAPLLPSHDSEQFGEDKELYWFRRGSRSQYNNYKFEEMDISEPFLFVVRELILYCAQKYQVSREEVYGVGTSNGANGLLDLARHHPGLFTAISVSPALDVTKVKEVCNIVWKTGNYACSFYILVPTGELAVLPPHGVEGAFQAARRVPRAAAGHHHNLRGGRRRLFR